MIKGKFRKLAYCPKCFSRKHIDLIFYYSTEINGNKIKKDMELSISCNYCKETFKLKLEGVIKE